VKILHLSTVDQIGGAARAARRLVHGLRKQADCSNALLVRYKSGDDYDCFIPQPSMPERACTRIRLMTEDWVLSRYSKRPLFTWSTNLLPDRVVLRAIEDFAPDIVHLHWIGGGHLPIPTLARLNRPVVWTLHDMWPFTGGCHVTGDCSGFKQRCGQCPQLVSKSPYDLSRLIWHAKYRYWRNLDLTVVAPSRWMAEQAKSSSLFSQRRVEVIPNGVNTSAYKPVDRHFARDIFGLPRDGTFILFGAVKARDDERKGYGVLQQALNFISRSEKPPELVVFGASEPAVNQNSPLPIRFVGHLHDDAALSLLYSACDVFVTPSPQESFSLVTLEALACGLPVVAFAGSGPTDLIDHQRNGYLARPCDPVDLARGIEWILQDAERHRSLRLSARKKAEEEFSIDRVAKRHLDFYQSVIMTTVSPAAL
jgi:glycosyltransferase involved in cell wall biosynthesis